MIPLALTYTYDPSKYAENGLDRMRMELGDTETSGEADTCALSDQEYNALLDAHYKNGAQSWAVAKFRCLEAIYMRMSYEVDNKVGPMSLSMGARADRWKEMYESLRSALSMPSVNEHSIEPRHGDGGHYFRNGMQSNDRTRFIPKHWPEG